MDSSVERCRTQDAIIAGLNDEHREYAGAMDPDASRARDILRPEPVLRIKPDRLSTAEDLEGLLTITRI